MNYDYEAFKEDIYHLIQINLTLYKEKQMKRRIESLMMRNGFKDFYSYYCALKSDKKLLDTFVNYLTINVSEFYRNPEQWERFETKMLPELFKHYGQDLHIWSAACSTGDEPYTIAMILAKYVPLNKIHILATDIDENVMAFAKEGYYNKRSVERLPKEFLNKYFIENGNGYQICSEIKNCVEFKKHNLLEDAYPTGMHLIVCRNVVIYFTDVAKDKVYTSFHQALDAHGMLFIGSTEQIIRSSEIGFSPIDYFFYKKI
ncbi:MAG: protein-glutamate O-methyltransferase CheR [Eubacteriales bacterium]|nr:protein-glutamate O-methyltransferase CheR [Eubacteriales bacterium]